MQTCLKLSKRLNLRSVGSQGEGQGSLQLQHVSSLLIKVSTFSFKKWSLNSGLKDSFCTCESLWQSPSPSLAVHLEYILWPCDVWKTHRKCGSGPACLKHTCAFRAGYWLVEVTVGRLHAEMQPWLVISLRIKIQNHEVINSRLTAIKHLQSKQPPKYEYHWVIQT